MNCSYFADRFAPVPSQQRGLESFQLQSPRRAIAAQLVQKRKLAGKILVA